LATEKPRVASVISRPGIGSACFSFSGGTLTPPLSCSFSTRRLMSTCRSRGRVGRNEPAARSWPCSSVIARAASLRKGKARLRVFGGCCSSLPPALGTVK
jgi:hypothetical protein